jgi:hypothetical protein
MTDFADSHGDLLNADFAPRATIGRDGFPQVRAHDQPGESRVEITIEPVHVRALAMG